MIRITSKGDFNRTTRALQKMSSNGIFKTLDAAGRSGVAALSAATLKDSGETSQSWNYRVEKSKGHWSIEWTNSHMAGSAPVAILLQYGHGTGTGGYVVGRDYINPAMKPVFDKIADDVWKAVTSA